MNVSVKPETKPVRCKSCNAVLIKGKIITCVAVIQCRCGVKNHVNAHNSPHRLPIN